MADLNRVKIGELCNIEKGSTGLAKALPGRYPLVATGAERKTSKDYQFDTKAVCIPLVSSSGHGKKTLNYVHYQEGKFALGTILAALIPKDENVLSTRYLHVYLQKNKDRVLVPLMKGAANVSLSIQAISNIEIPLPPVRKQEEIINKIDSISVEHRGLLNESDIQMTLFGKLRQAVLREAIEGKLTAEWRKHNPDVESSEKLLIKINTEKEELRKSGIYNSGEKLLEEAKQTDQLCILPEKWIWTKFLNVVTFITDYQANGSFASLRENVRQYRSKNYAILIRLTDLRRKNIHDGDLLYTDKNGYEFLRKSSLCGGELLMANVGANVGFVVKMPPVEEKCTLAPNMFIIKHSKYIYEKYFLIVSRSNMYWTDLKRLIRGGSQPKINKNQYRSIAFPLPPLAEQKAIIERVDKIMTMINELEKQVSERKAQSEMLMQSVLREAFNK